MNTRAWLAAATDLPRRRFAAAVSPEMFGDLSEHRLQMIRLADTARTVTGGGQIRCDGWNASQVVDRVCELLRQPAAKVEDVIRTAQPNLTLVALAAQDLHDNRLGYGEGRNPYSPRAFWAALSIALGLDLKWLRASDTPEGFEHTRRAALELVAGHERRIQKVSGR